MLPQGKGQVICPICRNVMIVVEQAEIELDHCTNCAGVWFDSGEMVLMLETMGIAGDGLSVAGLSAAPQAETSEKRRRCPICNRKMRKITVGQEPSVLIDLCPDGDGLWFDGGEVRQIIGQFATKAVEKGTSEDRVFTFLGETFRAGGETG